jgi:RHS repeat-associated protein
VRDGNNVNYDIDNLTNRYDSVGGNTLAYDAAGNLTKDRQGYTYQYDYENRITKIMKSGPTTVAEFAYDALGRRIKKVDSVGGTTNIYYYNDRWQVLSEYNGSNSPQRWFAYGNYIDEVLVMNTTTAAILAKLYIHDHLFSPVALVQMYHLDLKERYEYDAYGNSYILEPNFAPDPDNKTDYVNPYYFTGRQLDELDGGNLKIQYNRNRYYDYYTGRWLTHDPLGITPNAQKPNRFAAPGQYGDGLNLYEYGRGSPVTYSDFMGLLPIYPPPTFRASKMCMCFCPTWLDLDEASVEYDPPGILWDGSVPVGPTDKVGVKFDVILRGYWINWNKNADGRPVFSWWEMWTHQPTVGCYEGTCPNKWWDMFPPCRESAVFKDLWRLPAVGRDRRCASPVRRKYKLHDEPGQWRALRTMEEFDQRVFFRITVRPVRDCPCIYQTPPKMIKFTYRALARWGVVYQNWLKAGHLDEP